MERLTNHGEEPPKSQNLSGSQAEGSFGSNGWMNSLEIGEEPDIKIFKVGGSTMPFAPLTNGQMGQGVLTDN
jgi:hypothetical protein